jgi:hypothetical protein
MLSISRLLVLGLLSVAIAAATTAQADVQLFQGSWYVEAFGNECVGSLTPNGAPGPHCTGDPLVDTEFGVYSNWPAPAGFLCNPLNPRCASMSTPTDGMGNFHPLGGTANPTMTSDINCTPLSQYGAGITVRPAKGQTASPRVPPLYRNPFFFTPGGQPDVNACNGTSTGYTTQNKTRFGANKGKVMLGKPVAGTWNTSGPTGGPHLGGFTIPAGPPPGQGHPNGIQTSGLIGEFTNTYPYVYSYTYATIGNDGGVFGPGKGAGAFNYKYIEGGTGSTVASINVKQGAAKFGGTMRMLGAMTTKVCYWLQAGGGGCSLGINDWRYDAVGASAMTNLGVVTGGYIATHYTIYYNTANGQTSPLTVSGARFPWTTGSVTLTAVGRGPHKTVHYDHGYDNRNTTTSLGKGTVQMVSPVLTRWFGYAEFETGGIGVLRIKFVPEPLTWAMLIAGASLLAVSTRMRGR